MDMWPLPDGRRPGVEYILGILTVKEKDPLRESDKRNSIFRKGMIADGLKHLSVPDTLEKLRASADGLTREEVEKRLEEYGHNEITEKRRILS